MKSTIKKELISTKRIKSMIIIVFIIIAPILMNINLFSNKIYSQDLEKIENENPIFNLKTSQSQILSWWNETWNYRVRIDTIALNRTVTDVPLNKRINFTNLLHTLNDNNRLIWNSIRVVEYNISLESWRETNCTVYEYIGTTAATDYNDLTNAVVDITWIMEGTTLENDTRVYYIYFDSEANTFIFPERNYGFNQAGAYGNYGTKNLIYGDYFRIADFSASSDDLGYREGTSHYGNADNPFDNVYGNDPRVYDDSEYEGKVGRFTDKNGRQAHSGSDQRWHMEYYWDGTVPSAGGPKFPILKCAIKVDDPSTRTSLYVLTNNQWRVIFYTPDSEFTQGGYWVDNVYGSEIICDGEWHIYEYDLRWLYNNYGAYYATQIEFYQASGGTGSHYVYFDNLMCFQTDTVSASDYSTTGDIVYDPPQTQMYEPELKKATLKVYALDLNDNPIPNANVTLYNGTQVVQSNITDSIGQVTFSEVDHEFYNFTVSISSTARGSSYTEIVNDTSASCGEIAVMYVSQTINLTCNVGTTFFDIQDADGLPLESGWIVVGNGTNLQNCSIDANGQSTFQWLNTTPYEYNYSVYYNDDNYAPSIIILESGDITISDLNDIIYIRTNLTTINFTIRYTVDKSAIPGATLYINKTSGIQENVVQLTTDNNGSATFRWLNSSSTIINGNYSIKIDFYGFKPFNITPTYPPFYDSYEFMGSSSESYEFHIETDPSRYLTEIISKNPNEIISKEWGTQVRIRALFNVSLYDGSPSNPNCGPAFADSITYSVKSGSTIVHSGSMTAENLIGYYYGLIDTSLSVFECGVTYTIEISGKKKGYTLPLPISDTQLYIIKNSVQLNQSDNDDSDQNVYWSESVNMTLKAYSILEEYFSSNISFSTNANHNFRFTLPQISNDWNLTGIKFKLSDIDWTVGDSSSMAATITDPYNNLHNYDNNDGTWNFNNGWWNLPRLYLNNNSPTNNNVFNFIIAGTFTTLDIIGEALFTRDSVDFQYSLFNVTDDIIIEANREGWAIKKISFEILNCYDPSNWTPITPYDAGLNFTDPNNNTVDFGSGISIINFSDSTIYPIKNQYLFNIENSTPVIFDTNIRIEYIQEFYVNQMFEQYNTTISENGFTSGNSLTVYPYGANWSSNGLNIIFEHITNDTAPEDLAMNITIDGSTYNILDNSGQNGKYYFSLSNLGLNSSIHNAIIKTNTTVNITMTMGENNYRSSISAIQGEISYEIDDTSLAGDVPYDDLNEYYFLNLKTGTIDSDDDTYDAIFTFTKPNYYSSPKTLGLKVLERKTVINGSSSVIKSYNIYFDSSKLLYFTYNDTLLGTGISGSQIAICECDEIANDIPLSDLGNGLYGLDFRTETRDVGTYTLTITIKKTNYNFKGASIIFNIINRKFQVETENYVSIVSGNALYLSISLKDLENKAPLNETSVYTLIRATRYDFTDNGDGNYLSEQIPTPVAFFTAQTQVIDVYIERENYETEIITIVISVGMMEILPGLPTFWFLMIIGAMIAVISSLLVYRTVQQKRIPTFIKKSKGLIKAISSGGNISDSLIYPSKEVFIAKRFMKNWKVHDLSLSEILGIDKSKKKVKLQENKLKDAKGGDK